MPFQQDCTWIGRWRWKRSAEGAWWKMLSNGAFSSAVPLMSRATQLS